MKVKGESFTETLKTLRRGKRRKTEEDRSLQKEKKRGKKTEGQKEKPREENKEKGKREMKAKSERHKKIASKGASLGKLRDVLSASWDELNYLS